MPHRTMTLVACVCLGIALGGCQVRRAGGARPTPEQIAAALPKGATVNEIAYADLSEDGREEILVAATMPAPGSRPAAFVLSPGRRGRISFVMQRMILGEEWLPIQIGRPGDGAPMAAVFASRSGSSGNVGFVVIQQRAGVLQVTLEQDGLLNGAVGFVPEGLLESRGDTDRLFRWAGSGWQAEDLASQYLPPLPPATVTIPYTINAVRGPMIESARSIRARVGQHVFLRRMDRGEPSRVLYSGSHASYSVGSYGVITLLQQDQIEIHIEGPAYSGRIATILVRIDPP